MSLITAAVVKAKFPLWRDLCASEDTALEPEEVLQLSIDAAEVELLEHVTVTDATINDQLTRHLLVIVKKNCFDQVHAVSEFESRPQILKDYDATIKVLALYRQGIIPVPVADGEEAPQGFTVQAKPRRFDTWFNAE